MKRKQLLAMQREYEASKTMKEGYLHLLWEPILKEYALDRFHDVVDLVTERQASSTLDDSATGEAELIAAQLRAPEGRVNLLNLTVRQMSARATVRNPAFTVKSKKIWDEPFAPLLQQALSQLQGRMGWKDEFRACETYALLTGTGVIQVGFGSEYVYEQEAWSTDVPRGMRDYVEREMPTGPTTEAGFVRVRPGEPNLRHVPSTDLFFNLGVQREHDLKRIYHRHSRYVVDILRDARFPAAARREVWGRMQEWRNGRTWRYPDEVLQEETLKGETVQCFDVSSRQFCVFMDGMEQPLLDWTPFTLPIANPYHFLRPIPHPEFVWGIPYALSLLEQADAINYMRRILIDRIARDGKVINLIDTRDQGEDFADLLNAMPHGSYVGYENLLSLQGQSPVMPIRFDSAEANVLKLMQLFENDFERMSTLSSPSRNTQSRGGKQTATEVQTRQESEGLTVRDFVEKSEDNHERVAADVLKVLVAKWPEKKLIKVTGPDEGLYFWVEIERARLLSEWDLEVVAGSSQKENELVMRQQWSEALPRFLELMNWMVFDEQRTAQGLPPLPVNLREALRYTAELYDPMLAARLLRPEDTAQTVIRLMSQHNIHPLGMSPQLASQVVAQLRRPLGYDAVHGDPAALPGLPVPTPGTSLPPGQGGGGGGFESGFREGGVGNPGAFLGAGTETGRGLSETAA